MYHSVLVHEVTATSGIGAPPMLPKATSVTSTFSEGCINERVVRFALSLVVYVVWMEPSAKRCDAVKFAKTNAVSRTQRVTPPSDCWCGHGA